MTDSGVASRRLAIEAAERIDRDGAYANLLLGSLLESSSLDQRDRAFTTELVYGSTRMRRALDFIVDRYVTRDDVEHRVRAALRIGAYQLVYLDTPAHAAVDATVAATPKRARGFVNAVLRKVGSGPVEFPTDAIRLSYPDWIVDALNTELGERSLAVLAAMNEAAIVHTRDDGYRQDPASTAVADLLPADPGLLVADLCAAPGGKATRIGRRGATVAALDLHPHRAGLVADAAVLTSTAVYPVVADGTTSPLRTGAFDGVLVDAPCSGLGSLRRRPDARWRIERADVGRLAELQRGLLDDAARLVRPGGTLVFSVCTLTSAESTEIDAWFAGAHPDFEAAVLSDPWEMVGRGGRLLPDRFDGDAMTAFVYRRS